MLQASGFSLNLFTVVLKMAWPRTSLDAGGRALHPLSSFASTPFVSSFTTLNRAPESGSMVAARRTHRPLRRCGAPRHAAGYRQRRVHQSPLCSGKLQSESLKTGPSYYRPACGPSRGNRQGCSPSHFANRSRSNSKRQRRW